VTPKVPVATVASFGSVFDSPASASALQRENVELKRQLELQMKEVITLKKQLSEVSNQAQLSTLTKLHPE
jgi:hypothetical protein